MQVRFFKKNALNSDIKRNLGLRFHGGDGFGGHFRILDPMRRKFVNRQVDSANEIVEFDLQDVRSADIVLVNYNKPSIGTSMEVFYAAFDQGKFVISFSPFSFENCSPWMVRFSTKILPTLEDACRYIENNFGPTFE